jgi:hypothetical protein
MVMLCGVLQGVCGFDVVGVGEGKNIHNEQDIQQGRFISLCLKEVSTWGEGSCLMVLVECVHE